MDRIVIVTGGSRGIGAATAVAAAEAGFDVAFSYHSKRAQADVVIERCTAAGRRALAVQADVGREDDVVRLFSTVDAELGRLTALVANAGIVGPGSRLESMTAERIERIMSVNVVGAMVCAREAIRRLSTRHGGDGGSIVFVSSAASRLGGPGQYVDYAASKGAIDTAIIGLAREVAGEGIRVNGVRPGVIRTDIHASGGDPGRADRIGKEIPIGRPGEPEEVAAAIMWLLTDAASYTTGAIVDVTGGR